MLPLIVVPLALKLGEALIGLAVKQFEKASDKNKDKLRDKCPDIDYKKGSE